MVPEGVYPAWLSEHFHKLTTSGQYLKRLLTQKFLFCPKWKTA